MIKLWEIIGFDSQGEKVKTQFNTENECYEFAKNYGLDIVSVKPHWYGVSI